MSKYEPLWKYLQAGGQQKMYNIQKNKSYDKQAR
jgi:hypothetical protein